MTLDFRKGSLEDLEGSVSIFSQILNPVDISNSKLLAMFGTYDRRTFVRKAREQKLTFDRFNRTTETADIISRTKGQGHPWYSFPMLEVKSELELMSGSEDVVYAGRWSELELAMIMIGNTMMEYHDETLKRQMSGTLKPPRASEPYEQFMGQGKELKNHIDTRYVNPMIFAVLNGNIELYNELSDELRSFFEDTMFRDDAEEISGRVRKAGVDSVKLTIVDLLVQKIAAINSENHEEAARLRDEIKRLG